MVPTAWPDWWHWELELTSHLERRMEERGLTEVELHAMLVAPTGFAPHDEGGRFLVYTWIWGDRWTVVVEPDANGRLLVVVTAFRVEWRS